jgi:PAS domain-containing protein
MTGREVLWFDRCFMGGIAPSTMSWINRVRVVRPSDRPAIHMATLTDNGVHLIKAEQRLGLLLRAARTADADWNLQTGEIRCSPEWLAMLGLEGAADVPFDQAAWDALCHPEDLPACRAVRRRLDDADADDCLMSVRMRHPDGHWQHLEVRGVVATRAAGG